MIVIRLRYLVFGSAARVVAINLMVLSKMLINGFRVSNNCYKSFILLDTTLAKPLYFCCIRIINTPNLEAVFLKLTPSDTYPYNKDYSVFAIFEIVGYGRLVFKGKTYPT